MNRRLATTLTSLLAGPMLALGIAAPADARPASVGTGSPQRVCNSSKTPNYIDLEYGPDDTRTILSGHCADVGYYTTFAWAPYSYRVAYDGGKYGKCKPGGRTVKPSAKHQKVYYKGYAKDHCKN